MSVNRNKNLEKIAEVAKIEINDLIAPDGYYISNDSYFEICRRIAKKVGSFDGLYDITDELGLDGSNIEVDIERFIGDEAE